MNRLRIGNTLIEYPSGWNELSSKQLKNLSKLYLTQTTRVRFDLQALLILLDIHVARRREELIEQQKYFSFWKGWKRISINSRVLSELINTICWLHDTPTLTRNVIPVVRAMGKRYFGPSDGLYNLTFEEFMIADQHFAAFATAKDPVSLDLLAAVLYRPQRKDYDPSSPDHNGDRREPFNDFLIEKRARRMKRISKKTKFAVYIYFQGCKGLLMETFPLPFKPSEEKVKDDGLGYLRIVDNLNGGDPTKNEAIRKLNLYEVFTRFQVAREQADEMKSKLKSR